MFSSRFLFALIIVMGTYTSSLALPHGLQEALNSREITGFKRSFSVPIQRRSSTERRRDGVSGSVGLGDNSDR